MFRLLINTQDKDILEAILQYIFDVYSATATQVYDGLLLDQLDTYSQFSFDKYIIFKPDELENRFNVITKSIKPLINISNFHIPSINEYSDVIASTLDAKAKEYGYDNIISSCSYTNSSIDKYRLESVAFTAWRDYLWSISLQEAQNSLDNHNPMAIPTFIGSLPTYESFLNT